MSGVEGKPTSLGDLGGGRAGDMQWWLGKGGHRWTRTQLSQVPHTQKCHTQATRVSHTQVSHTHTENSMSGKGPLVMIQPNPCPGHLEKVTLVRVGWDVSVEGDSALSLGSCPRAWPSMMEVLPHTEPGVLELRAWLLVLSLGTTGLCLAPSSHSGEIVGIAGGFVGIGGIPPQIFV